MMCHYSKFLTTGYQSIFDTLSIKPIAAKYDFSSYTLILIWFYGKQVIWNKTDINYVEVYFFGLRNLKCLDYFCWKWKPLRDTISFKAGGIVEFEYTLLSNVPEKPHLR